MGTECLIQTAWTLSSNNDIDRDIITCIFILTDTHHISYISIMHHFFSSALDLECIFTVICNLVTKSESPDEELEMAKLICTKIIQQPSDKPVLRLKM